MLWTWFDENDGKCWSETFPTAERAIVAMAERQGDPAEGIPASMARIGLFLASVRLTVTPLMVLRPAPPSSIASAETGGENQ